MHLIKNTPFPVRLGIGLLALFTLLVSLGLHGYSIPVWSRYLGLGVSPSILTGRTRDIRADDWELDIPLMLAQAAHSPRFPLINSNIGEGQYMTAPIKVPIATLSGLFRPSTWGFWMGKVTGISWMWWFMVLGLLYALFLVFAILSKGMHLESLLVALLLVFSPGFQFWAFHKSEIALFAAAMFVALYGVAYAKQRWKILISGGFLGWSAGCFLINHIYPALQITVGYWLLFLVVGYTLSKRSECFSQGNGRCRLAALVLAGTTASTALLHFWVEGREWITLISHTVYPGRRFMSGGHLPLHHLFSNNFFPRWLMRDWTPLINQCESASFLFVFPLVALVYLRKIQPGKWGANLLILCLFLGVAFELLYSYVGFPIWLARVTGMGMSLNTRTQMATGLFDGCLLILLVVDLNGKIILTKMQRYRLVAAWLFLLALFAFLLTSAVPEYRIWKTIPMLVCYAVVGNWLLNPIERIRRRGLALLLLMAFAVTLNFNPLVRGGITEIYESPLSKKLLEVEASENPSGKWVVFGNDNEGTLLAQLPRMLGIPSIGGYHGYPHATLWKHLDASGRFESAHNQSAFVNFAYTKEAGPILIKGLSGYINVQLALDSPELAQLHVTKYLLLNRPATVVPPHSFTRLYAYDGIEIFVTKLSFE